MVTIESLVIAKGSTNHAAFVIHGTFFNNAGTLELIASTVVSSQISIAGISATFAVDSNIAKLMVTGLSEESFSWVSNSRKITL